MSIVSVMPSNHLILSCPLLLPPLIFPSIRVFSNESVLHIKWPKYWSFSFSISPSNEQSGVISFRMDWLDLLAVQGTLKNLMPSNSGAHQQWDNNLYLILVIIYVYDLAYQRLLWQPLYKNLFGFSKNSCNRIFSHLVPSWNLQIEKQEPQATNVLLGVGSFLRSWLPD